MGRVFDFLFPLECVACGAPDAHACGACLSAVGFSPKTLDAGGMRVAAGFAYAQPLVRTLIHDAKYEGWTCALGPLETLFRRWVAKAGVGASEAAAVVPVPLHPRRLRMRGFNQASALAAAASAASGLRVAEGFLSRERATSPQTEAPDRRANVAGAFACRPLPAALRGKTLLLVDDVVTSGATMGECADALAAAGAGNVRGLALAWGSGLGDGTEKS